MRTRASFAVGLDEGQELLARLGVLPEHAQHGARDGPARVFLNTPHHHAHVAAVHKHTQRRLPNCINLHIPMVFEGIFVCVYVFVFLCVCVWGGGNYNYSPEEVFCLLSVLRHWSSGQVSVRDYLQFFVVVIF